MCRRGEVARAATEGGPYKQHRLVGPARGWQGARSPLLPTVAAGLTPVGRDTGRRRGLSSPAGRSPAMARKPRSRFADLAAYALVRVLVCVFHALPPHIAFWLSDRIAWLAHRLDRGRRRVAL